MPNLYFKIFNRTQAELFPQLKFLEERNFYLAGGTALALQLGHRTSVDFDFYTPFHFDSLVLSQEIEDLFGKKAKPTLRENDTLFCKIAGVDLSFFWYKYPLLKKSLKTSGPPLASIADIAAMKLISITQRPVKRDYIDIFYVLKIFPLGKLFSFVKKKYPNFNQYFALRALTYYEDLEERRRVTALDPHFSWEKAKKEIFEAVRTHQLAMIKKR